MISEYSSVDTYRKGYVVNYHGKQYKALVDALVNINPLTKRIRVPVSVNIERSFFRTIITKEFDTIQPWAEL